MLIVLGCLCYQVLAMDIPRKYVYRYTYLYTYIHIYIYIYFCISILKIRSSYKYLQFQLKTTAFILAFSLSIFFIFFPTVRNLTSIIFNILIYSVPSYVASLPTSLSLPHSDALLVWTLTLVGHHPAQITSLYCLWAAFPSCPPSSSHGPWLPLGFRKEGLNFKCWPSYSSLKTKNNLCRLIRT